MRIGVLAPVAGGYFIGEVLAGVVEGAALAGAHVVVIQTHDAGSSADGRPPPEVQDLVSAESVDGFVVLPWAARPPLLRTFHERGIPAVLVCSDLEVGIPRVGPDNRRPVRDVVEHLARHGHERIVFVGDMNNSDARERFAAYSDAMASLALAPPRLIASDRNLRGSGAEAVRALMAELPRATAVVAATDLLALGVLDALAAAGLSVPEDVAVVGFDDVEEGRHHKPPLATVHQDVAGLGRAAVEVLVAEYGARGAPAALTIGQAAFIPRQSCGCGDRLPDQLDDVGAPLGERLAQSLLARSPRETGRPATARERVADLLPEAAEQLVTEPLPPEALALAVRAFLSTLARDGAPPGSGETAMDGLLGLCGDVATALLRAESARGHARGRCLSETLARQYEVGVRLLGRSEEDPSALGWLRESAVSVGALGLWQAGPDGPTLRVAGVFDPESVLPGPLDARYQAEAFPPSCLVDAADPRVGDVAYVVPVRGSSGDHGLLCLVAPIERENGTFRGTYNNWAALLGAALLQRRMVEELRAGEERLALAARATRDGLWDWSPEGGKELYSARSRELLGDFGSASDPREPRCAWLGAVVEEDRPMVSRAVEETVANLVPLEVEFRVTRGADVRHWVQCRAFPVGVPGARATRVVGAFSDVHGRKEEEAGLRYGALHDAVTGLPNRRHFADCVADALAAHQQAGDSAGGRRTAVVFIDLDDFKSVNDVHGHAAGDEVLRAVAQRLRAELREADVPARLGGDEFAVLISGARTEAVIRVVERTLREIARPLSVGGMLIGVTASAGLAFVDSGWDSAEDILSAADEAMYRAKRDGKAALRIWPIV